VVSSPTNPATLEVREDAVQQLADRARTRRGRNLSSAVISIFSSRGFSVFSIPRLQVSSFRTQRGELSLVPLFLVAHLLRRVRGEDRPQPSASYKSTVTCKRVSPPRWFPSPSRFRADADAVLRPGPDAIAPPPEHTRLPLHFDSAHPAGTTDPVGNAYGRPALKKIALLFSWLPRWSREIFSLAAVQFFPRVWLCLDPLVAHCHWGPWPFRRPASVAEAQHRDVFFAGRPLDACLFAIHVFSGLHSEALDSFAMSSSGQFLRRYSARRSSRRSEINSFRVGLRERSPDRPERFTPELAVTCDSAHQNVSAFRSALHTG